jgi:hypothetical protein
LCALAFGDTKMNTNDNKNEDSGEFEVGDDFAKDLRSAYEPKRNVPADFDRAIMNEARKHLSKNHSRLKFARWAVSAAAAAVVVFAFVHNYDGGGHADSPGVAFAIEDIDRNGRVDILDAYVLARSLKSAGAVDQKWDVNADGVVNGKDIDAVAASAVRLKKGV